MNLKNSFESLAFILNTYRKPSDVFLLCGCRVLVSEINAIAEKFSTEVFYGKNVVLGEDLEPVSFFIALIGLHGIAASIVVSVVISESDSDTILIDQSYFSRIAAGPIIEGAEKRDRNLNSKIFIFTSGTTGHPKKN